MTTPASLLRQEMARLGVEIDGLFRTEPQRRTSRKTRVMGASQQVVRIDRETRTPAGPDFLPGRPGNFSRPACPGSTPWSCPITPKAS